MDRITATYSSSDFVEIQIGDKSKIVKVEDLSEISDLLNFIGENLNIEIKEIENYD